MNDNRPICPHCITEINYDDMIDDYFDTSTYEAFWRGTCPECGRHFTWKEIYHYSYINEFKEEINDG